jgi:adenine/guanine phosphoribosyltransferase-like PRPP-binding protein
MRQPQEYWQSFSHFPDPMPTVWQDSYAATMRDGSALLLPLRDFGARAVAGFIVNQASFAVVDRIAGWIAADVLPLGAEIVAALPTLGHAIGAAVARALGHAQWAPLGTTRKLWYDEALSVPTHSITSPAAGRAVWLDPRLLPRLAGRRVLLVDDVISTGSSARAGVTLLAKAGIVPVGFAVAMIQGNEWRRHWDFTIPVHAAFSVPSFDRVGSGWVAEADADG